jgi:hypothetical protein
MVIGIGSKAKAYPKLSIKTAQSIQYTESPRLIDVIIWFDRIIMPVWNQFVQKNSIISLYIN